MTDTVTFMTNIDKSELNESIRIINGLYVNNNLVISNSAFSGLDVVQIGSAEGATRSNASYNYIKVIRG